MTDNQDTFTRTNNLRWERNKVTGEMVRQQQWLSSSGGCRWEDVGVVFEMAPRMKACLTCDTEYLRKESHFYTVDSLNCISCCRDQFKNNSELLGAPEHVRRVVKRWSRESGYVFTTIEKYKVDTRLQLRKYTYNHTDRLTTKETADKSRGELTDCYIATNIFKKKVGEVPADIIETQRLIIKIKRELKQ